LNFYTYATGKIPLALFHSVILLLYLTISNLI